MHNKPLLYNCPVCNGIEFKYIFKKNAKTFYRCINCHFELIYPVPSDSELKEYYDSSYNEGLYKDFIEAVEMKVLNAAYRFGEVSKYIFSPVLDVGCSDGHFLNILGKNSIEAEGIDISQVAVSHATNKGLKAVCTTLSAYNPVHKFKTITGFDIIEHLSDPAEFITQIKGLLEVNGFLILSTPNRNSVYRRLMRKNWYFYIPEEHLIYFDKKTIKTMLEKYGFKIVIQKRFLKPLTLRYGLSQFKVYNPFIYKILKMIVNILPENFVKKSIALYIGEMLIIATLPMK
jgi:SAM-dependent methyltransferase